MNAMADHSSTLLKWFGCRRFPTARPATDEWAIHSPSGQKGAKTWTNAVAALAMPASMKHINTTGQMGACLSRSRESCCSPRPRGWLQLCVPSATPAPSADAAQTQQATVVQAIDPACCPVMAFQEAKNATTTNTRSSP